MTKAGEGHQMDDDALVVEQAVCDHGAALQRFCLARTSHVSDADDAMQETLLHFVRHARHQHIENPEAWLVAVAARVCHRMVLRRSRFAGHEPVPSAAEDDPADTVVERSWVEKILGALQASDRDLLTSLYMRDQAPAEVAAAMGRPEGTVRWLAHRARARAREAAIRLSGAGAAMRALLSCCGLRRTRATGPGVRARAVGFFSHPSLGNVVAGPAWFLLVAGSSGLLHDTVAPAVAAPAVQGVAWSTAAAPAAHAFRAGGGEPLGAAASPTSPPAASSAAGSAHPHGQPVPAYVNPPLANYVLPSADPHDTVLYGTAASPTYDRDRTLFTWGTPTECIACTLSEALYRSGDGGHTWQLRAAVGYTGGPILLPYDYDRTHVVFALNNAGLWRSDDDGNVFIMVVPLQIDGGATLVPAPGGDSVVWLGGQPLIRYDEHTGQTGLGPRLPTITGTTELAYTGARLLVHGYHDTFAQYSGLDSSTPDQYLLSCNPDSTSCTTTRLPEWGTLAVSPVYQRDHTVAFIGGWQQPDVELSSDGGRSFAGLTMPPQPQGTQTRVWPVLDGDGSLGFAVETLVGQPGGPWHWTMADVNNAGNASPLGGDIWAADGVGSMVSLPDGTLLALLWFADASGKAGFRCSHDAGATWSLYC